MRTRRGAKFKIHSAGAGKTRPESLKEKAEFFAFFYNLSAEKAVKEAFYEPLKKEFEQGEITYGKFQSFLCFIL